MLNVASLSSLNRAGAAMVIQKNKSSEISFQDALSTSSSEAVLTELEKNSTLKSTFKPYQRAMKQ